MSYNIGDRVRIKYALSGAKERWSGSIMTINTIITSTSDGFYRMIEDDGKSAWQCKDIIGIADESGRDACVGCAHINDSDGSFPCNDCHGCVPMRSNVDRFEKDGKRSDGKKSACGTRYDLHSINAAIDALRTLEKNDIFSDVGIADTIELLDGVRYGMFRDMIDWKELENDLD